MESSSKLKNLFTDASALPASDRDAFLKAQCAGNPVLRERLEALLAAHEEAGEYLAQPTLGSATMQGLSGEGPGNTIGPYKVLELIGEGGFGVVYMAEQREPVRRRVALKVIKPGMDSKQVIARFEQERQALAMMDHPNIAKVLDAGATQSGRPYFVMELVRGDPITAYADARNLPIPERLELFQQVCHAVQHAHQKGIIHRDLKPSNILVAEIDGRLTPRIIDFGIAKATGGTGVQLTDKTVFTEFRQFIGTPEYMSPEQAGMGAVDIDTRSDIYSLGVLLYALLTGGPPFDPKRLRSAAWEEMRRIIREDEPQRPSTRLHTRQDTREIAAHRQTEPARLIGLIRGDLDWIVMKCLEKDRARRYETANGLAADVARHLSGEPVLAAPPSTAYQIRKFVRRNRAGVTAAGLVTLVGLIGLVGTSVALWIARGQRDRAVEAEKRERQRSEEARRAAQEAEDQEQLAKVALALIDFSLGFADPASPGGQHLEVREMLRLAEEGIPKRFPEPGAEQILVRTTLGQRWLRIDESLRADAQMRKAIELIQSEPDPDLLLMFEARSALYACGSAGVHEFAFNERRLLVDAAVRYLTHVNAALGAAAAEYAECTMWQGFRDPRDAPRIERAGRALLKAANAWSGMTSAHARAVTAVFHIPCPEGASPHVAAACGPILLEWLGEAERLHVDENTMLELRHTVLKSHVIVGQYNNDTKRVAWDQLRATAKLLPAYPWQRLRYDACAARTLAFAGDAAAARPILVEIAGKARNSQSQNHLAARVLLYHLLAVAAKTHDRALVTDAFDSIDEALIDPLLRLSDNWWCWQEADLVRPVLNLASARSMPNRGARRVLGSALAADVLPILSGVPDGQSLRQRLVEFLEPGDETPTVAYAQALFGCARGESELGDWKKACDTYELGLKSFIAVFGEDAWFAARGRFLIGNCEAVLGDPVKGLAAMRDSIRCIRDRVGPDHPVTLVLEYAYYARLLECGERHEANDLLRTILSEIRAAPPQALDYVLPLLRMAALQQDLDVSAFDDVSQLAHDATGRRRLDLPDTEPLLAELMMLLKQNKKADASALACEHLRTALETSPPSPDDLINLAWGVAPVAGLHPDAYIMVGKCVAKIPTRDPAKVRLHVQQLRSMAALRRDKFEDAVKLATESDAEWIEKTGRGLPDSAAVRACALAHLERWDDARANLEDARLWARDRVYATPLIGEAAELIGERGARRLGGGD